ncbi:DUF4893 domain-containing protein [Xanthomonas sp. F1]
MPAASRQGVPDAPPFPVAVRRAVRAAAPAVRCRGTALRLEQPGRRRRPRRGDRVRRAPATGDRAALRRCRAGSKRGAGALLAAARTDAAAARQAGRPLETALDPARPRFAYAYPYFKAEIRRDPCGYRLSKTSGSQRRSGTLYPLAAGSHELAFLGASTVNSEPEAAYAPGHASDGTHGNSVGRLVALGPNKLLLILDGKDNGFELYQLIR